MTPHQEEHLVRLALNNLNVNQIVRATGFSETDVRAALLRRGVSESGARVPVPTMEAREESTITLSGAFSAEQISGFRRRFGTGRVRVSP